ncbi:hypothetical protein F9C07_7572 [Aspergillus flavus]|uniref:BZIP transcription factor n=1 Tax=Aspergillus flavus (strain ATCC 200026 / FGSC A1120 / IAM 13836 / NRRL 3357 / JCM 12722 / SRRC 167) TaxID=332952 RepID=A0A7U2QW29_ASPFN|nr:uncharacterized protein G4B84_005592 [Aspergillus flavus NRRL3357]KAF7620765.1 hypothetical protein AFLA_006062 [Aspergillus flavus NRRL3357]QMW30257.1 hypothetical protein G4B84_005592 [Aspergillus flavus NRRL3357]QRD86729.1 hypothetical protein F9C07_7572 [Aspergillus flavus]
MQASKPKSVGSIDKKRARDRRAQQKLRADRLNHTHSLEANIVLLEQQCKAYEKEIQELQTENEALQSAQQRIREVVCTSELDNNETLANCDGRPPKSAKVRSAIPHVCLHHTAQYPTVSGHPSGFFGYPQNESAPPIGSKVQSSNGTPLSPAKFTGLNPVCDLDLSLWSRLPLNFAQEPHISENLYSCFNRPDLVQASPDEPSPVELLYGSSQNFLADRIHKATRFWPICDPEHLASGLLTYNMIKWLTRPSQESFGRLLGFQRPINDQLQRPHPRCIDFVMWPVLRANLVKTFHKYDLKLVFAAFTCSLRIRWPWGKSFLEPDVTNSLRVHKEFYDTFTKIEGWGLSDEFQTQYPELLVGMDIGTLNYSIFDPMPAS